jgi:hypothetical protein
VGKTGIRGLGGRRTGYTVRLLAALFAATIAVGAAAASALAANPVQLENSKPGDSAWEGAVTAHVNFLHPPIDGYASATSVRPGGTLDFFVNVPHPARYRVEISRLGWYGGAGGRRLTCLVGSALDSTCTRDEPGVQQPAVPPPDPVTGEVRAAWSVTDHLQVPDGWVSGYYLAIFKLTTGSGAGETGFAPFIVQAPAGDHAQVLVEVPTNTWQAYNAFGGEDVYTTPQAVKVSFDRPYQHHHLFRWEYPLVRFLERGGYDVSYATDDDVDRDPGILLDHRLDIAAGHGEYWTKAIRDGWDKARARGVNLAFGGANTGYWQVRYEDEDRTMVSYKSNRDPEPDPALKTVEFRHLDPPRPECELVGEQSSQRESETGQYFSYTLTRAGAADPWFARSGLRAGGTIPGIVGFEFDSVAVAPSCHVPPVTALLRFSGHSDDPGGPLLTADAVRYRACSGSEVFDAGSLFFSWGLDSWRDPEFSPPLWPPPPGDSPVLQRAMANALGDMLIAHPRPRAAGAVHVVGHGSELRIDPGVPSASLSVQGSAIGFARDGQTVSKSIGSIDGRGAVTWHPRVPRSAVAVVLDLTARTGEVRDSRQYVLLTDRHGRAVGPASPLSAASCYGSRAHVLTAVFGGPRHRRLRVAVDMPRPFTLKLFHGGERAGFVRVGRRRGPGIVEFPPAGIPCGRVPISLSAGGLKLTLSAVRACAGSSRRR